MKKESGFTLVELLAVIIVMGIIAIIAVPNVNNIIKEQRKNTFDESIQGIIKSIKNDVLNNTSITSSNTKVRLYKYDEGSLFLIKVDDIDTNEKINLKGVIKNGTGYISTITGDDISMLIYNNEYCAVKKKNDKQVLITTYSSQECVNDEIQE